MAQRGMAAYNAMQRQQSIQPWTTDGTLNDYKVKKATLQGSRRAAVKRTIKGKPLVA